MTNYFLFLIMFFGGMTVALQPSINARLAQRVGILESAFISFAVGTLVLLLVVLMSSRGTIKGIYGAAWWELTGGGSGSLIRFTYHTGCAAHRNGSGNVCHHSGTTGHRARPRPLRTIRL
ncbi:MAG: DMT family transporter [Desulfobacteraceae bacterium]|nr:MAG: DMT family transporter [Desulfobacteraceae bacterium]